MAVLKKDRQQRGSEKTMILMDFSGVYAEESFYEGEEVLQISLQDLPGTNCYCDEAAIKGIRDKICPEWVGRIHFIDSGNYHYISKIWTDYIQEPFCLVVFDNHTDMQLPAFGDLLSCGGWIQRALMENEYLKNVVLIGPDEQAGAVCRDKILFLSREKMQNLNREALVSACREALQAGMQHDGKSLPVYFSIDKDILNREAAHTNWSQGDMTLEELLGCLRTLLGMARQAGGVLGMDVCGEADRNDGQGSECNDLANRELLSLWKEEMVL